MIDQFSEDDWKFLALAFLFASLAYLFVDVATTGVIRIYSVLAYMIVLVTVLVLGPLVSRRIN